MLIGAINATVVRTVAATAAFTEFVRTRIFCRRRAHNQSMVEQETQTRRKRIYRKKNEKTHVATSRGVYGTYRKMNPSSARAFSPPEMSEGTTAEVASITEQSEESRISKTISSSKPFTIGSASIRSIDAELETDSNLEGFSNIENFALESSPLSKTDNQKLQTFSNSKLTTIDSSIMPSFYAEPEMQTFSVLKSPLSSKDEDQESKVISPSRLPSVGSSPYKSVGTQTSPSLEGLSNDTKSTILKINRSVSMPAITQISFDVESTNKSQVQKKIIITSQNLTTAGSSTTMPVTKQASSSPENPSENTDQKQANTPQNFPTIVSNFSMNVTPTVSTLENLNENIDHTIPEDIIVNSPTMSELAQPRSFSQSSCENKDDRGPKVSLGDLRTIGSTSSSPSSNPCFYSEVESNVAGSSHRRLSPVTLTSSTSESTSRDQEVPEQKKTNPKKEKAKKEKINEKKKKKENKKKDNKNK